MANRSVISLFLCITILMPGCARVFRVHKQDYQTISGAGARNADVARQKNIEAICLLQQCDYVCAEQLLNEALSADASFGPAHNTLGKVYFQQKKYYLAAWEFEYANRLMPERIEPINNLGLVYESVGQFDHAISYYESAVSASPDTAEFLGNLIRARLLRGDKPFDMQDEIQHLILIDDRQNWVNWAKIHLLSDDTEQQLMSEFEQSNKQQNGVDMNFQSDFPVEIDDGNEAPGPRIIDQTPLDDLLLDPPD